MEKKTPDKVLSQPLSEAPKKLKLEDVFPLVKDPFIINHISEIKTPQLKEAELTERDPESELFLYFEGGWDGEKNIYIYINNKSVIVAKDLIVSLVNYFKRPFTDCPDPSYMKMMNFNNFPPMRLKVCLNNFSAILLSSFEDEESRVPKEEKNNALVLLSNVVYTQEWLGDVGYGPGKGTKGAEVTMKKLYAVNAKDIFENPNEKLNRYDDISLNFSLIESFKIYFVNVYTIEHYLKHKEQPATYDLLLEIKNHIKLRNNFILSTEHLNLIQLIVNNILADTAPPCTSALSLTDQDVLANQPPLPEMISTYKIKINRFKINLIKMVQDMELAHITLNKVIMRMKQEQETSFMRARAILDVKYFNRRKMNFEPFLEPWCFMLKYDTKKDESQFEICNWQPVFEKDIELKDQHLNKNALNLNVSVAAIETILELVQLFTNKMKEAEPYKVKNYTGFTLKIHSSNPSSNSAPIDLLDKHERELSWQFFKQAKKRHRYVGETKTKAYLDVQVIGKERRKDLLSSKSIKEFDNEAKSYTESIYQNIYKQIKQVDCDLIGKRYYKLRSKKDNPISPTQKSKNRHFDFPFFANKKTNEATSVFMICSVHLNPATGSKEIILRSGAMIRNNLKDAIQIRIIYKNRSTNMNELIDHMISPGDKYYIPIEALEEKAKLYLSVKDYEDRENKHFSLAELLDDKIPMNEYSDEEEGVVSADEYKDSVSSSNEKWLRYRTDQIVTCYKGDDKYSFALSIIKRRIQPGHYSQSSQEEGHAYEHYIVMNPVISFTNATVRPIAVSFILEGSKSPTPSDNSIRAGESKLFPSVKIKFHYLIS